MPDVYAWWSTRPWWLRWAICLIPAVVCAADYFSTGILSVRLAAIAALLVVTNLILCWSEILDVMMPRRRKNQ